MIIMEKHKNSNKNQNGINGSNIFARLGVVKNRHKTSKQKIRDIKGEISRAIRILPTIQRMEKRIKSHSGTFKKPCRKRFTKDW